MMSRLMPDIIRNRPKLGMNQGAGFGSNDPGKSIYYKAISEYYKTSPDRMKADLKTISNYKENYQIDESIRKRYLIFAAILNMDSRNLKVQKTDLN